MLCVSLLLTHLLKIIYFAGIGLYWHVTCSPASWLSLLPLAAAGREMSTSQGGSGNALRLGR